MWIRKVKCKFRSIATLCFLQQNITWTTYAYISVICSMYSFRILELCGASVASPRYFVIRNVLLLIVGNSDLRLEWSAANVMAVIPLPTDAYPTCPLHYQLFNCSSALVPSTSKSVYDVLPWGSLFGPKLSAFLISAIYSTYYTVFT